MLMSANIYNITHFIGQYGSFFKFNLEIYLVFKPNVIPMFDEKHEIPSPSFKSNSFLNYCHETWENLAHMSCVKNDIVIYY